MKRKLITQIRSEWRSNLWLTLELLIVSVVLWFGFNNLIVQWQIVHLPNSYHTDNCFLLEFGEFTPGSDGFDAESPTDLQSRSDDMATLLDRVKRFPGVEAASVISSHASVPHRQSLTRSYISSASGNDSIYLPGPAIHFVSPEYFTVLRMEGADGETPEEMSALLERGCMILSENTCYFDSPGSDVIHGSYYDTSDFQGAQLRGHIFEYGGQNYRVSGIVKPFKRMRFEYPVYAAIFPYPPKKYAEGSHLILLRTTPEAFGGFKTDLLKVSKNQMHVGNFFLKGVFALDDLQAGVERENWEEIVRFCVIIGFLLVSVFLGLLGTFWFRTQQRVGEIAIRKVNGASERSIFLRLITEGLLLLLIATPFAGVLDWMLTHYNQTWDFPEGITFQPLRFSLAMAFSFVSIAAMIVVGIWFPARKAMRIEPAAALKDE